MNTAHHALLCSLLAIGVAVGLNSCSTPSQPKLDAKTASILDVMDHKLASAKTLRVAATRQASRGFYAGVAVAEDAKVHVALQRPNKLVAVADTPQGRRTTGYDGSTITLIDHAAGTHATVAAAATIDATVRSIENTFGFSPPLSELLANEPRKMLLDGVRSGKHVAVESIAGTLCDHLAFQQSGMSWDLWVSVADSLPKRIKVNYPNGEGGAPLSVTSTVEKWELNAPLTAADLTISIPASSQAIEMIPLNQ